VALLVSGCSFTGFGTPPNYGYLVITAGGVGLRSGAADVPPNLDLRLHATGAPLQASDVTATLDGNSLTFAAQHQDLLATVQPLLPLSSAHHLSVAVAGLSTQNITFTVVAPTAAMLAAHIDPASGLVVDAVSTTLPRSRRSRLRYRRHRDLDRWRPRADRLEGQSTLINHAAPVHPHRR